MQVGDIKIDLEGAQFPDKLVNHEKLVLPEDAVIAQEFSEEAESKSTKVGEVPEGWIPFDIGEETLAKYLEILGSAKTVIWAGAIGAYEVKSFSN